MSVREISYNGAKAMPEQPPPSVSEDTYAFQREELLTLLQRLSKTNESLVIHGVERLTADDAAHVLHKVRQRSAFSSRERRALTDAGFSLHALFPHQ
jgi:hypothetical protein